MIVGDFKSNLSGLLHGANIDKVNDIDMLIERGANTLLMKISPLDTMRVAPLASTIHDDVYNYALPGDYKKIIGLYPQDDRNIGDSASKRFAEPFDLEKAFADKEISIESDNGTKFARINWNSRAGQVLNTMDSLTANGAWSAVGSAAGLKATEINKISGTASIEFDLVLTGDGIKNSSMTALDMTDEDEIADIFVWVYLPSAPTSISARWGNDLTTNYWSAVAQTTQADGSDFKTGWNLLKFSWSTATETGSVDPTAVDSFEITLASSVAMSNVRVDNIIFSIGRNFDLKYYSKYLVKNPTGTWISRTTDDSDVIILDNDCIQLLLLECLIAAAQQAERADDDSDIKWAREELKALYAKYEEEYPSQAKKSSTSYYGGPRGGRTNLRRR